MLKDFKPRLYQETILSTAVNNNTLVVLPTGMGKTAISVLLASHRLKSYPYSKILILAPTKPLVEQHIETFKKYMDTPPENMYVFTGSVAPEKRAELWKTANIIFSTPQGLENDIITRRVNLEEVSLIVFDEAHRAVGDYAYVFVAKQYQKLARYPRILALTASPGSDLEKIQEITTNLFIEKVEVRTSEDIDVKPYIQEINIEWVKVDLPPPFEETQKYLKNFLKERMEKLKKWGVLKVKDINFVSKKDLLKLQAQVRGEAVSSGRDFVLWNAVSVLAEIMKVQHGLELLESQGIIALHEYLKRLQTEGLTSKTKAVKNIVSDTNFKAALIKTQAMRNEGFQHPKLIELQRIISKEIKENPEIKIIVFNQFRENAHDIVEVLNKIGSCKSKLFVGQAKKLETGLSQKDQKQMLEEFAKGLFNTLVATSVGEEGLDIPKVDLVIFYEPIPSAIRTIQRRGRTGRLNKGRVIILMTKNTRDEAYRWSAHHKEKQMYRNLSNLKSKISLKTVAENKTLDIIQEDKVKIFIDHREKGSAVVKELIDKNTNLNLEQLNNADFILSERCGVEFKTKEDFVNSIIDGRLLEQIKQLKYSFERPLVIIEGEEDIYSIRNVHANAINGMLATIVVSYGIPILQTKNSRETASLLYVIAKREQLECSSNFTPHSMKRVDSLKSKQEYVASSFPGIGMNLGKELLKNFKTVKNIVNAEEDKLKEVENIGDKKAKELHEVFNKDYEL